MSQVETCNAILESLPYEQLEKILDTYGVASEFIEFSGNVAQIPMASRLAILSALGVTLNSSTDLTKLIEKKQSQPWMNWLEPVTLVQQGQGAIRIVCQEEQSRKSLSWQIKLENSEQLQGVFQPDGHDLIETFQTKDNTFCARQLIIPDLPLGYHELSIDDGEQRTSSLLIVAPARVYEPEWLLQEKPIWGASVQLYSLTSSRNWGIGDFSDLLELIELASVQGADFLLLNPLHAADVNNPENASPYSPVDRRYLNPLYIDPCIEDDFVDSAEVQAYIQQANTQENLILLQQKLTVDYTGVFILKYHLYDFMFKYFKDHHLGKETSAGQNFNNFIHSHGKPLLDFAKFQADRFQAGISSGENPDFHLYLQWIAHRQLQACQNLSAEKGMKIGIIRDLAVGSGSDSCEVLTNPELFCLDARIGAPPDNFNPDGQNWGLAPMCPNFLKTSGFQHYISLLRENMADCGALRIDHILALMRLWWCPVDKENGAGAYVHYPVDELFAILRLESVRAQCVIIGEDLGVVPPEIRTHIAESGILSNIVFYFEKYDGWHFKKPEHYQKRALAIVANHDVPTLKAWWNLTDLTLRRELNLIPTDEQYNWDRESRVNEKHQVLHWLEELGKLPEAWQDKNIERPFDISLCSAILRTCATANSVMISVQLDDLAGLETPVNIPGTNQEYPNWRRKIMIPAKQLFASDETGELLSGLQQERP